MNKQLSETAKRYKDLQDDAKKAAEELKAINAEWAECEAELLECMVEEGVNSIQIAGMGLFSMKVKNYLSVTAANKEFYFDYLKRSGNDGILKLDINPKTNSAFLDSHLQELLSKRVALGEDEVSARQTALEFLKTQAGVSYFSDRTISLRTK